MPGSFSVAYTATPLGASNKLCIEATHMLSPGITSINPTWYKWIHTTAAAAASPADIKSAYEARFGTLIQGKKIALRLRVVSSEGKESQPFETSCVVA